MRFAGKMNRDQFFKWLNPEGMTIDEMYRRERLLDECVETDEEVYDYFLGVLPPMHFSGAGFAICEATTEDLRLAFFRRDGRYFAAYVSDHDKARTMAATRDLIALVVP